MEEQAARDDGACHEDTAGFESPPPQLPSRGHSVQLSEGPEKSSEDKRCDESPFTHFLFLWDHTWQLLKGSDLWCWDQTCTSVLSALSLPLLHVNILWI